MLTSSAVKAHARTLGFDVCGIAPATALPELARMHDWLARGQPARCRISRAPPTCGPTSSGSCPAPARSSSPRPTTGPARRRAAQGARRPGSPATRTARTTTSCWPSGSRRCWPGCGSRPTSRSRRRRSSTSTGCRSACSRPMPASAGSASTRCVINRDLGSWLLLAGMATTLPLEPDALVDDQCGALHAVPRRLSDRRHRRAA